jgi:hypothetical protein
MHWRGWWGWGSSAVMLLFRTLHILGLFLANLCVFTRRYGSMHTEGNILVYTRRPLQGGLFYIENHLCTYDLYVPLRNVFDAGRHITWASGRGLGPGNRPYKS